MSFIQSYTLRDTEQETTVRFHAFNCFKCSLIWYDTISRFQRLDCQHHIICTLLGDIYSPDADEAVRTALKPREENEWRATVLDVGSGSGVW